jgi:hypothetical protein
VVTEVSVGGPSCVLVAGESGAEAELILAAGPTLAVGLITQMSFTTRHGMAGAWITENPVPLMMRAHYLRSSFIGSRYLSDRGVPEPGSGPNGGGSRLAEVYDSDDAPASA